jgi:predicted metalloendopeptidase
LPDRDYYVSEDADSKEKNAKYVLHVAKCYNFDKPAAPNKAENFSPETEQSKPRLDRVERRDRRKSYNPMTLAELSKLTPSINWNNYFTKMVLESRYGNCITT